MAYSRGGGKRIEVNTSSLVDLKAELFRKQHDFQKERAIKSSSALSGGNRSKDNKRRGMFGRIPSKNKPQPSGRNQEPIQDDVDDSWVKTKAALEKKASIYEQMTSGKTLPDEDGSGSYLVDFQKKYLRREEDADKRREIDDDDDEPSTRDPLTPPPVHPDEEWVDYIDTLGRSRRCMRKDLTHFKKLDEKNFRQKPTHSEVNERDVIIPREDAALLSEDMRRELERQRWEREAMEEIDEPVGPVHYQSVYENEVRDLGVGYYHFATEEGARQEQMDRLNELHDQTKTKKDKREKLKEKRRALMESRLAKVKLRKMIRDGIDPETIPAPPEWNETEKKQSTPDEPQPQPAGTETLARDADLKQRKIRSRLEWDRGKVVSGQWKSDRPESTQPSFPSDERNRDFAPPRFYQEDSSYDRSRGFTNKPPDGASTNKSQNEKQPSTTNTDEVDERSDTVSEFFDSPVSVKNAPDDFLDQHCGVPDASSFYSPPDETQNTGPQTYPPTQYYNDPPSQYYTDPSTQDEYQYGYCPPQSYPYSQYGFGNTDGYPSHMHPSTEWGQPLPPGVPLSQEWGQALPPGVPPSQEWGRALPPGVPPSQEWGRPVPPGVPPSQEWGQPLPPGVPLSQEWGRALPPGVPPSQKWGRALPPGVPLSQEWGRALPPGVPQSQEWGRPVGDRVQTGPQPNSHLNLQTNPVNMNMTKVVSGTPGLGTQSPTGPPTDKASTGPQTSTTVTGPQTNRPPEVESPMSDPPGPGPPPGPKSSTEEINKTVDKFLKQFR